MVSTTQDLQNFGYRFLGPLVTAFFDKIVQEQSRAKSGGKLFFLAREGYFLKDLYEEYCSKNGLEDSSGSEYLLCSRAFLFKLSLVDSSMIPATLQHHYSGSFSNFICRRYVFNGTDLSISLAAKLSHHFGFDIEMLFNLEALKKYMPQKN